MDLSFDQWRKHIDYVVATEGLWVGLADEDGYPLVELPAVVSGTATVTKLSPGSCEISCLVGEDSVVFSELVAELGQQDDSGRLRVSDGPTRLLVIDHGEGGRMAYTITHTTASGNTAPERLTIYGAELAESLAFWPGASTPIHWQNTTITPMTTDASGVKYSRPLDLGQVKFATAADGHTITGPAVTVIRKFIQDSLDAGNAAMGWIDPHMVVDFTPVDDVGPELWLRTDDSYVWDTVAKPAKDAGVDISVRLYWPGDDIPVVRVSRDPEKYGPTMFLDPVLVVSVERKS